MSVDWLTLDCYGTLIDWEGGISDALMHYLPAETDRRALAEWYIAMEAEFEAEAYHLYKDVLDRAGRRLLKTLEVPLRDDEPFALPTSLADWTPFRDVSAALKELRARGHRFAILSNVDRDLLKTSIGHLGIVPDLAVTAEDCGSYKPAPGHWIRFLELTGADAARVVHVGASQFHDMIPAKTLGFRTVFINRHDEPVESAPTRVLPDLARLPDVIEELE